jgi:hypothetical protein
MIEILEDIDSALKIVVLKNLQQCQYFLQID